MVTTGAAEEVEELATVLGVVSPGFVTWVLRVEPEVEVELEVDWVVGLGVVDSSVTTLSLSKLTGLILKIRRIFPSAEDVKSALAFSTLFTPFNP